MERAHICLNIQGRHAKEIYKEQRSALKKSLPQPNKINDPSKNPQMNGSFSSFCKKEFQVENHRGREKPICTVLYNLALIYSRHIIQDVSFRGFLRHLLLVSLVVLQQYFQSQSSEEACTRNVGCHEEQFFRKQKLQCAEKGEEKKLQRDPLKFKKG